MKKTSTEKAEIIQNGGKCILKRYKNGCMSKCNNQTGERLFLIHAMRGHDVTDNGRGRKTIHTYSGIKEVIIGAAVCDACMEKYIQDKLKLVTGNCKTMKQLGIAGIVFGATVSVIGFFLKEDYWVVGSVFAFLGLLALISWLMQRKEVAAFNNEIKTIPRQALYKKHKLDAITEDGHISNNFNVYINAEDILYMTAFDIGKVFAVDDNTAHQIKHIMAQYNTL